MATLDWDYPVGSQGLNSALFGAHMIDIEAIILEVADEWDSIEYQDMDTPAAHAVALATEVAKRAVLAEREACADAARELLTKGRSPLGKAVHDAIMARSNAGVER